MDKKGGIWEIIQALTGIYCSVLGTVSWLFPVQPGQPLWQGPIRVTAPPTFAIALALLGGSIGVPAIIRIVQNARTGSAKTRDLLDIQWKPGEIKYYMSYGISNLTLHYRICVKNKSVSLKLNNVRVELKKLDPDELPCVPCHLRLMNDLVQGSQKFIETFELKPLGERFVDLMAQDANATDLYIWHTVQGIDVKVKAQPYVLDIWVTADGADDCKKRYQLFQNGPYWNMRDIPYA